MIALALALGLAAGGGPDTDLPRSLSAPEPPSLTEPRKDDTGLWIGVHLGITGAYDAADPNFTMGGGARLRILPWLGAEATIDFNTRQNYEHDQIHVTQVPLEVCALFYPPVDWPVRPYGLVGLGLCISDTNYTGSLSNFNATTELNPMFFLGFGAEFELQPNLMLDANMRFLFIDDPPHFHTNSADAIQFTVGILLKL